METDVDEKSATLILDLSGPSALNVLLESSEQSSGVAEDVVPNENTSEEEDRPV